MGRLDTTLVVIGVLDDLVEETVGSVLVLAVLDVVSI